MFDNDIDSPVITVGTPFGEGGSSVTADGLYLLAGQDIIRKGEVVALEMDLERGGALEVKVGQLYSKDNHRLRLEILARQ